MMNVLLKNEKLRIKNDESCIKHDESCSPRGTTSRVTHVSPTRCGEQRSLRDGMYAVATT